MTKSILRFIQKSKGHRFLVGATTIFIIGITAQYLLLTPIRNAYYGLMPGNFFLNVSNVTVPDVIYENEDAAMVLCRNPRTRVIAYNNIRTYYKTPSGEHVYKRNLPDGINYENTQNVCQPILLQAETREVKPGKYYLCQELSFNAGGFTKHASFCSNEFEIKPDRGDIDDYNKRGE